MSKIDRGDQVGRGSAAPTCLEPAGHLVHPQDLEWRGKTRVSFNVCRYSPCPPGLHAPGRSALRLAPRGVDCGGVILQDGGRLTRTRGVIIAIVHRLQWLSSAAESIEGTGPPAT